VPFLRRVRIMRLRSLGDLTSNEHWCHKKGWFLCHACQQEVVDYLQNWMVKMTAGREHYERRKAQAAAAAPPENKARALKYPGRGNRTRVQIDRDKDYWFVELGVLSHAHGGASYPFPSYESARAFALFHKHRDIHRSVSVIYPDGSQHPIRWEEVTGNDPEPYVRKDLLGDNQLRPQSHHPVPEDIIRARHERMKDEVHHLHSTPKPLD
jgi:hypothetical protein